jgi:glycosyltransferase involved in cell wall biosynthesis
MEQRVKELISRHPDTKQDIEQAPPEYWDGWREECALADRIVVNSVWARNAVVAEGVPLEKIRVIPLAYVPSQKAASFRRDYPLNFTVDRPLRVLFLGQVTLLKGVLSLLEAAQLLTKEPLMFDIVGARHFNLPNKMAHHPQVRWIGPVPRGEVAKYYRDADVFVFPTFADGFGLTQLEAQAWKLPVVASRFCGDVVRDGINGVLLNEISAEAIANVLLEFVRNPKRLRDMAACSGVEDRFSLNALASSFLSL